jgi:uncharacterized protein YceH (UPF0502 family)
MEDRVTKLLCEEIGRIKSRMSAVQHDEKSHVDDQEKVSAAKVELAALHARLDELHEKERKCEV